MSPIPIMKFPRIPKLSARYVIVLVLFVSAYAVFEFSRGADLSKARKNYKIARDQNDPSAVIKAIDEIMRLDGKASAGYVNRAYYHAELEDLPSAIQDYNKALEIEPDCVDALTGRARLFFTLTQYDKSIADYSQVVRLDPNCQVAYRFRGCSYSRVDQMDKAFADFNEALKLNPKDGLSYFVRGTAHEKAGQNQLAADDYTAAAMDNTPRLAKLCYELRAGINEKRGKAQQAKEDRKLADKAAEAGHEPDFGLDLLDQEVIDDKILTELKSRGCELDKEQNIDHKFFCSRTNLKTLIDALKKIGLHVDSEQSTSEPMPKNWVSIFAHERAMPNYMPQRTEQFIRLSYKLGAQYIGWSAEIN
jgi:tetratricopeptide (TPR) repeat protein